MLKKKITLLISAIVLAAGVFEAMPVKAAGTYTGDNIESAVTEAEDYEESDSSVLDRGVNSKSKTKKKKLTIMYYGDGDNNLERALLRDVQEMKDGYVDNPDINLIAIFDRTPYYSDDSEVFGEDFTDTRMYKIEHGKTIRIDGGKEFPEITKTSSYEANMGDADTLKKFIDSCKANYPAEKYSLIMADHGGGARSRAGEEKPGDARDLCWDETNNSDCLYTAEISDTLTKKESVDVLAYDACLMGTAEVAYQYRPGNGGFQAKYMVASAPSVWGAGFDYKKIFERLRKDKGVGTELEGQCYDPAKIKAEQLGNLMVDTQRMSIAEVPDVTNQSLCNFDLSKVSSVKKSVDKLSRALWLENDKDAIEKIRGTKGNAPLLHYFYETYESDWKNYPYFDLYELCKEISTSNEFSRNVQNLAKKVMKNVDSMIKDSFGGSDYKGFTEGKNGLSILLPDGGRKYKEYYSGTIYTGWRAQRWYNAININDIDPDYPYGGLYWCKDGATSKKNDVGNWFELLDSWFDTSNGPDGGDNYYQW